MSRVWRYTKQVAELERSPLDWALSRAYGELAYDRTGRSDVDVCVARGTVSGAKGAWWPNESVLELDGSLADGLDAVPDLATYAGRAKVAALHGVFTHEVAHANHTVRTDDWHVGIEPALLDLVVLFEEPRIEHAAVNDDPRDARWLRASTKTILGELTEDVDPTRACLLLCARHDAGVLTEDDIAPVRTYLEDSIGADVYERLRNVWNEAINVEDGDVDSLVALARTWCEILDEAGLAPPTPEPGDPGDGADGSGTPGSGTASGSSSESSSSGSEADGDGDGETGLTGLAKAIADAADAAEKGAADSIADAVADEADDKAADEARREREAKAAAEAADDAKRAREAKRTADATFSSGDGKGHHTVSVSGWRAPTTEERGAATHLADVLRNDMHRPPARVKVATVMPPGRLRPRGAVKQSAQLARGEYPTAKPFVAKKRVIDPPLTLRVGLAVDRSGSMSGVINDACSAAYIIGAASQRVGGKFAAVTFGNQVEPMCRPGSFPTQVPYMRADAGTEAIGTGLDALIGALELRDTQHLRLVVILSDAQWVDRREDAKGRGLIAELAASGCRVVIAHSGAMNHVDGADRVALSPGGVAETVASEMRKVLARA